MTLLLINIIIIFMVGILFPNNKMGRKLFIYIAFILLFFLHAFLDPNTMQDLPGYWDTYKIFGENSLRESILVGYVGVKMEPGWILLCKILYFVSNNPRLLLIVTSILMVGSYLKTISRYSYLPWLSVIIYLCTTFDQSLFVLRQHSAIALSLLSIPLIINRDLKRYLLMMLICVFIHSSSAIFIPMYFLHGLKMKHYWLSFCVVAIVGSLLAGIVFPWLFSHTWYNSYEERGGSNYTVFFITMSSLILYLVSIKFKVEELEDVDKYFLLLITVSVLLCLCGVGFSPTNRLVKYFSVASIFVIPRSISHFKDPVTKMTIIFCVCFFHLLLFLAPSNTEYIQGYRFVLFD